MPICARWSSSVEALPGVRDVALTSALPMQGWGYGMPFQIADKPARGSRQPPRLLFQDGEPVVLPRLGHETAQGPRTLRTATGRARRR